jgi:hypothetical protein
MISVRPISLPLADDPSLQPTLRPLPDLFPPSSAWQSDLQQIAALLTRQYAAQEARDASAYMQFFWKSPLVAYFREESVAIGWDQVKANVEHEFSTRPARAQPALERLRANPLDGQTALTIEWWTLTFPLGKLRGFTSSTWHKFPEGWRIIQAHTKTAG